jgi:hypothetical protein
MLTFRAIASLIKRSDSWRMASFDIAGAPGFLTINSPWQKGQCLAYFYTAPKLLLSPALECNKLGTLAVVRVQVMFATMPPSIEHIRAGKLWAFWQ